MTPPQAAQTAIGGLIESRIAELKAQGDTDAADKVQLAWQYFTNPTFRASVEDMAWRATQDRN